MPVRWDPSTNVLNFKHTNRATNINKTKSYKTNVINNKNARGYAPNISRYNRRRANLYNPNLDPNAARANVAAGINAPRNYSKLLNPENASRLARLEHANLVLNDPLSIQNLPPPGIIRLPPPTVQRANWNQRSRKVRNRNARGEQQVVRNPFYQAAPLLKPHPPTAKKVEITAEENRWNNNSTLSNKSHNSNSHNSNSIGSRNNLW